MTKLRALVFCLLLCAGIDARLAAQEPGPEAEERAQFDAEEAERMAVLVLRLSDELEPEARAAALAVIETLPGVVVGRRATHEIGPRPGFEEIIALYEIPGAIPRVPFSTSIASLGISSKEQSFEFYSGIEESENGWARGVSRPVELGDHASAGFAERLRGALGPLSRKAALEEFALLNSDRTISVCLGNELPSPGTCPLPREGRSWNEVTDEQPIYLTAEAPAGEARHFTVIAVTRAGEFIPLAAGEGVQYVTEPPPGPADDVPRVIPEVRLFFKADGPLNDRLPPGQYDLLVITDGAPVPAEAWTRSPDDAAAGPETCPDTRWRGLCRAVRGGRGVMPYDMESDIARTEISVITEVPQTERVVRGMNATRGVSLWQAQLFRFRPEDAARGSGLFSFRKAHRCGGAYIGDGFVLTAAHCIPDEVSEMRVRLGTSDLRHGGRTFKVRSLVLHEFGSSRERRVDLALIQLNASEASLEALGRNLAAIDPAEDRDPQFSTASGLTATGWGFVKERLPGETGWKAADGTLNTKADRLQQALLAEADMSECTARPEYAAYREEDMLCLRGLMARTDTCAGDSGGPVTSRAPGGRELVGIVSTGVGCAYRNVPAVYVNVANHRDWIDRARKKMLSSRPGYYQMR